MRVCEWAFCKDRFGFLHIGSDCGMLVETVKISPEAYEKFRFCPYCGKKTRNCVQRGGQLR
jgi:hypothetical protein